MKARSALRAVTAANHERVDLLFSRFDLSSPGGYAAFLAAQAGPFLAVEAELERRGITTLLPDWEERKRGPALIADLADLRLEAERCSAPALPGHSAQLGAAYVLEGSRLGGKLLAKRIPDGLPCRFLCHAGAANGWRKLLERLNETVYEAERIEAAGRAAQLVFDLFEAAGRRKQEAVSA